MIRAVATILRGSILAQALGFVILPLLSRSYAPEAFGNLQAFQAIFTFMLTLVTMRYEIAVLRTNDDRELAGVLALCGVLTLATTAVASLGFLAMRAFGWPKIIAELGFPWWLLCLSMLVGGAAQVLGYVATRAHGYALVSNSKVGQALANAGCTAGLAVTAPIPSGLILGDLAGRIANLTWLARGTAKHLRIARTATWVEIRAVAGKFRDLSTISLPSTLLSTAGTSLTPLFVYGSFDAATSGQFGLVERSAGLPVALIVVAVSQVHMAHLAADLRSEGGDARRNFRRIATLLAAIAILPAIGCVAFAGPLYRFVFGPGWTQAALFAQLMAPAYLLALVTGGINMTLTVMGRQKTQFAWDAARFATMALLWMLAPRAHWPIARIIGAHSAILSLYAIAMLVLSYRALPRGEGPLEIGGGNGGGTSRSSDDAGNGLTMDVAGSCNSEASPA